MSEQKKYLDSTGLQHLVSKIKSGLSKKADLDDNGKIPASQLPSYVDDVLEFTKTVDNVELMGALTSEHWLTGVVYDTTRKEFLGVFSKNALTEGNLYSEILHPAEDSLSKVADKNMPTANTPEAGKIYVELNTNKTYRWSGSDLIEITSSLALGETSETAYSGDKGAQNAKDIAANAKDIAAIKSGDLPLVSPEIVPVSGQSSLWQVKTADSEVVSGSWGTGNLTTIYGYHVWFSGCLKWTHKDGYKDPTEISGDWYDVELPASGVASSAFTLDDLTNDSDATASIRAPKQGLVLSNGIIKEASSTDVDTKSVSVNVHFQYKTVVSQDVEEDLTVSGLTTMLSKANGVANYKLQNSKSAVLTDVTTDENSYFVYAYPAVLGDLTKITMNDATPLLADGFTKSVLTVTDPETKASIKYNVYTSVQKGAFTGAKLDIA